jgi:glycosyltransferase involved in cell wall biosynthesis
MRIALVVPGGVDRSGRERVIPTLLWLIERLAARHAVHVFVLRHYPRPCTYQLRGATIHDLGRARGPRGLRSIVQLGALIRALRAAGPFDVIHGLWAMPSGLLASLAGSCLGIPIVVTFDSGELVCIPDIAYGQQCSWRGRFAVRLIARLARLHVCSEYMERFARAKGLSPVRIPIGVDGDQFQPPLSRTDGPPWRLLHVASLNTVKDQGTLLRAFVRVVDAIPDVHLDIVGEDALNDRIQRLCETLQLRQHVTFHGFQPTSALPAFYQRAHLLVASSRHEAAGVGILEAAMCGLPAVGTNVGYVADWSPEAAVAVPVGDESALAEGVMALLRDPMRRAALANEAMTRARSHDADWSATALEDLYLRVL